MSVMDPRLLSVIPEVVKKLRMEPKTQHHWGLCRHCGGMCLYMSNPWTDGSKVEIHLLDTSACVDCKDIGPMARGNTLTNQSVVEFGSWLMSNAEHFKLSST